MAVRERDRFSEFVAQAFSAEKRHAKTLWGRLAPQFDSEGEGPDSVKAYLDARRQQLADRVKISLDRVKERIDD